MNTKKVLWIFVTFIMIVLISSSVISLTASERKRVKYIAEKHNTTPQEVMDRLGIEDESRSDSNNGDQSDTGSSGDSSENSDSGGEISFEPPIVDDSGSGNTDDGSDSGSQDGSGTNGNSDSNENDDSDDVGSDIDDSDNSTVKDETTEVLPVDIVNETNDGQTNEDDDNDNAEKDNRSKKKVDRQDKLDVLKRIIKKTDDPERKVNRKNNVIAKDEIAEYRTVLRVADTHDIKINVVRKLISKKRTDEENYDAIVDIVRVTPTQEDSEKEELVEELVEMDSSFIAKVSTKLLDVKTRQETQEQVEEYLKDIQDIKQHPIQKTFDRETVKQVFNDRKSFDQIFAEFG